MAEKEVSYKISGKDVSGPAVDSAVSNMKKLSREEELANKKRLQDQANYWVAWHAYQEKIEREQKESQARMVQQNEASTAAMTRGILRLYAAYYVLSQVGAVLAAPFTKGFNAVEQYKQSVAETAAMVMSFSEKSPGVSQEEQWKQALAYAKGMIPVLEDIAAKTLLSGQETIALSNAFARSGVFLDGTNEKQIEAFTRISNALPMLTHGQEIMRQINTEVRSLMTGQNEESSMLLRTLKAIDPEIEKHLKTWRANNEVMERIGELLAGQGSAAKLLENTWETVKSTIDTTANQVLRGAMEPACAAIIEQVKDIDKYLKEHKNQVQNGIYLSWMGLAGVLQTVQGFFKPMTPELKQMAEWSKELMSFLAFTAYAVLPPLAEKLGSLFKASGQVAFAWATKDFSLLKDAWKTFEGGFKTDFLSEVERRSNELILKFNDFQEKVKPPKGSYTDPKETEEKEKEAERKRKEAAAAALREQKLVDDQIFKEAQAQANALRQIKEISANDDEKIAQQNLQREKNNAREILRVAEDLARQIEDVRYNMNQMQGDMDFSAIMGAFNGTSAGGPMADLMNAMGENNPYKQLVSYAKSAYDQALEATRIFSDEQLELTYKTANREAIITQAGAQKMAMIEKAHFNQRMTIASSAFGVLAGLGQAFYQVSGEQSREWFRLYQVAAIAQATIDTISSAQSAFAWGMKFGGPPLAAAFAAMAVAAGVARVAQIASQEIGGSSSVCDAGISAATATSSPSTDTGSTDTGTTASAEKYVNHTYQITVMGNIIDQDAFARELIGSIRKAEEDNA